MRKVLGNAKRGFTLVELSIVIAVIAVLAAVLIPTFVTLVKDAGIKTARVAAEEEFSCYFAEAAGTSEASGDYIITYNGYAFLADDGDFKDTAYDLSSGNHEDAGVSLSCGTNDTTITITLVTNETIKGIGNNEGTITIVVNKDSDPVITVSAQIKSGKCTISAIKKGSGTVNDDDTSTYSYLHDGAAIYAITYS